MFMSTIFLRIFLRDTTYTAQLCDTSRGTRPKD